MATPDLDQTLSLKASMDDAITPVLQKIDKGLKTTQDALNELSQSMLAAGQKIGSAAEGMSSEAGQSTEKLQKDLKDTGGAFGDLGDSAEKNSERVGQALKDSLYSRDASQRLTDLDKELGGLKNTFEGMASTARPARGKAKSLQAIGKDSINKKVIPAFQELHATLDDFPDTLEDITRLQRQYTDQTGKFGGLLSGVSDRVDRFGGAIEKFKFTIQDFVGAIAASATVIESQNLQQKQLEVGQIGGIQAFRDLPQIWATTLRESEAPIELWESSMQRLVELGAMSSDEIPRIVAGFVDIHKATGLTVESITEMHDRMETIGGMKGEEFTGFLNKAKMLADDGRVSMEGLMMAVQGSASELRVLSGEARKAYAENVLTTVSGLEEMGLAGAQNFEELKEAVYGTVEGYTRAMAAMQAQGLSPEAAEKAYRTRDYDVVIGSMLTDVQERMGGMFPASAEGGALTPVEKGGMRTAFGGMPLSDDMIAALRDTAGTAERLGLPEGSTPLDIIQAMSPKAEEMAAGVTGGRPEDYMEAVAELHRATIAEQIEQGKALVEEMRVQFATTMAPSVQAMAQEAKDLAAEGIHKLMKWDEQYDNFFSKAIGFYSLATPVMTALRGVLSMIPGMGGISKMMEGGLGGAVTTTLGALGLNKLFGGGGDELPEYKISTGERAGEVITEKQYGGISEAIEQMKVAPGSFKPEDLQALATEQGIPVEDLRDIMVQELERQQESGGPSIWKAAKHRMSREWEGAKFMAEGVWQTTPFGAAQQNVEQIAAIPGVKESVSMWAGMETEKNKQAAGAVAEFTGEQMQRKAREAKIFAVEAIGGPGETLRQGMEAQLAERLANMQVEMLQVQEQTQEALARGSETDAEAVKIQQEHKEMAEQNLVTIAERMTEVRDELRKKGQLGFRPVQVPGAQSEEEFLAQEAGR